MRSLSGVVLALALAALLGCSEQAAVISAPALRKPPPAASLPAADAEVPFHYSGGGGRDPFASYVLRMRDIERRSKEADATPLERFDLTQLQLQAIIWGSDRARALVLDPSGKGYVIGVGSPIGKNDGRVVRIAANVVLVKETYVDFRGRATTKDIEMRLSGAAQGG